MCRLFGLHAGPQDVAATFWLIDAPDSLRAQSHRNPDGAGVGTFGPAGQPEVSKQPIAAWEDAQFAAAAQDLRGTTFVAHVRYASTGAHTMANTHPFQQDGRLFAHNGVVQGLSELDGRLADLGAAGLVGGETDSERIFALITAETRRSGGDVTAGLTAAVSWIGARLPVYALNLVLITPTGLWALRYPATHELYVLDRPAGGRPHRPRRGPGRGQPPDPRPVPPPGASAVGDHRQRADGRRSWLAAAGPGRTAARQLHPADREQRAVPGRARAPADRVRP